MSNVVSIKARTVDQQIEEIRACDNVQSVHVIHRLDDGAAAVVCVVPHEQQGEPGESDWALVTKPYLMLIDPDGADKPKGKRPQLSVVVEYPDREAAS